MKCVFIGILLSLLAYPLGAQEAADDDAPPAELAAESDERDALEPGVDTSAPQPRRRTEGSQVMDEIDLGRTEITGNQELPKVLYIVPWQKSDPGDLMGKPVNTLLDEVLAPIDRGEFVRQVRYYDDLQEGQE